jgi:hypothetical protein
MQENKNLVEEALIQMRQVEEAISENAKGILQSTMKEEISQLVKESLSEEDDEEMDMDTDVEMDDESMDTDNDMEDEDMEMDMDMDSDETTIDLTDASDEEILKVFKAMGEEDGIIVKKDGKDIHLTDNDTDSEYLVKLGESMEEYEGMEVAEENDSDVQSVIDALFSDEQETEDMEEENIYEIEMDDNMVDEDDMMGVGDEYMENIYEIEMDDNMVDEDDMMGVGDEYMENIYEIEMDDMVAEDDEDMMDEDDDEDMMDESYNPKKAKKGIKPKGMGIGKPKFEYKKTTGGFDEKMKEGPKKMGTGKAKFTYGKGENMDGKPKMVKKSETKEASRTYGMGSLEGRGLRKGITPNRNLKFEAYEAEIGMLRQKNEEYRKALNTFREKLNEVAIFNSNLAYATRLFTEHSTTKKEKINILRRFDGVETLKESKNLYKSVKDELSKGEGTTSINESVETKLSKNVSTGSSTTLIESKTYENPQFMRIKDLMGKIV